MVDCYPFTLIPGTGVSTKECHLANFTSFSSFLPATVVRDPTFLSFPRLCGGMDCSSFHVDRSGQYGHLLTGYFHKVYIKITGPAKRLLSVRSGVNRSGGNRGELFQITEERNQSTAKEPEDSGTKGT
jgi:hypothetical protein